MGDWHARYAFTALAPVIICHLLFLNMINLLNLSLLSVWCCRYECEIKGLQETYFYYNNLIKLLMEFNEITPVLILQNSVGSLLKDPNFMSRVTLILLPPLRIE